MAQPVIYKRKFVLRDQQPSTSSPPASACDLAPPAVGRHQWTWLRDDPTGVMVWRRYYCQWCRNEVKDLRMEKPDGI